MIIYFHGITLGKRSVEDLPGKLIEYHLLKDPLERPRPVDRIEPDCREIFFRTLCQGEIDILLPIYFFILST